jgi:hypothetical protein
MGARARAGAGVSASARRAMRSAKPAHQIQRVGPQKKMTRRVRLWLRLPPSLQMSRVEGVRRARELAPLDEHTSQLVCALVRSCAATGTA